MLAASSVRRQRARTLPVCGAFRFVLRLVPCGVFALLTGLPERFDVVARQSKQAWFSGHLAVYPKETNTGHGIPKPPPEIQAGDTTRSIRPIRATRPRRAEPTRGGTLARRSRPGHRGTITESYGWRAYHNPPSQSAQHMRSLAKITLAAFGAGRQPNRRYGQRWRMRG